MPLPGIRRSARLQVCAARADSRTRRSSGKPQRCSVSLLALEFGTGIEPVTPASTCCALPSELPNRASALPLSYRSARFGRDSNPRLLAWWKCLFMPSVRAAPIRRRSAPAGRQEPQPMTHEHLGHSQTQLNMSDRFSLNVEAGEVTRGAICLPKFRLFLLSAQSAASSRRSPSRQVLHLYYIRLRTER